MKQLRLNKLSNLEGKNVKNTNNVNNVNNVIKLGYLPFGLIKNPFRINCYRLEKVQKEEYPRIETPAVRKIINEVLMESNVVLTAPKGTGKSTALDEVVKKIDCISMIGFRSLADVYNLLWEEICDSENEETKIIVNQSFEVGVLRNIHIYFKKIKCEFKGCYKGDRCFWMCKDSSTSSVVKPDKIENLSMEKIHEQSTGIDKKSKVTLNEIKAELQQIRSPCPLKRKIVDILLDRNIECFTDKIFLFDVFDDLLNFNRDYDITHLDKLFDFFQKQGKCLIITATNKQYKIMEKAEAIERINCESIPLPSNENLIEIYEKRVKIFQKPNMNILPFDESVIKIILKYSHNVTRIFLKNCHIVLMKMIDEGRKVPADINFVRDKVLWRGLNETDSIELMVEKLCREKRGRVEIGDLCSILLKDYGIKMSTKSLGISLKRVWKLERKRGKNVGYLFH